MFTLVTLLGVVGASLILIAFVANRFGCWSTTSLTYDAVNALGALLLIAYSYLIASYPFILLNVVWLLVAIKDLVLRK